MKKEAKKTTIYLPASGNLKKITIPKGRFCSDTFVCSNCGFRGVYKVYGNTKTCPECGGTMYRQ